MAKTNNNIPKPHRETATSPSTQRSSLWKRLGRRGSKPQPLSQPSSTPPGTIPLKSTIDDAPVEADNGDARSLSAKRVERKNSKNNGKGGGGLIRKLKSSFRKTPANSSDHQSQPIHDGDDSELVMLAEHQRSASASHPNSPAYSSTDSFVTVEVGRSRLKYVVYCIIDY